VLYSFSHRLGPIRATPARAGVRGGRLKGALPHTVERAVVSAVQRSLRHCAVVPKRTDKSWFFIPFYSFSQNLTQPERCDYWVLLILSTGKVEKEKVLPRPWSSTASRGWGCSSDTATGRHRRNTASLTAMPVTARGDCQRPTTALRPGRRHPQNNFSNTVGI